MVLTEHAPEVIRKEPIIKSSVVDKPIVEEVIEHRTIEVHHKPVIVEIHEQPIIEIERKVQTKYVQEEDELRTFTHEYKLDDPNLILTDEERLLVDQYLTKTSTTVKELKVRDGIKHTIKDDVVEVHDTPVVHTVITQPVIRNLRDIRETYTTAPTVVETKETYTTTAVPVTTTTTTSTKTIPTIVETTTVTTAPVTTTTTYTEHVTKRFGESHLRRIVNAGTHRVWGILEDGTLYRMRADKKHGWEWIRVEELTIKAYDIAMCSEGVCFFIGEHDRFLYKIIEGDKGTIRAERYVPTENLRLMNITVANEHSVYALSESGLVYHFYHDNIAKMSGKLRQISIGGPVKKLFHSDKYELWGIGIDGHAWVWNGMNKWLKADNKHELIDICVAKDLSVYAVRVDGVILNWNRDKQFFEQQKIDGAVGVKFKSINAFKNGSHIFAVDVNGNVLHLKDK